MRSANPLASKQTALFVFRSSAVLLHQQEAALAFKWKLERPLISIPEDNVQAAYLWEIDLSRCTESSRYQKCLNINPKNTKHILFSSTFLQRPCRCIKYFQYRSTFTSTDQKSRKITFWSWLLTSPSNAHTSFQSDTTFSTSQRMSKDQGCRVCIITIKNRKQSTHRN